MTYAELGRARGIKIASAERLASRRKWRRQLSNDGTTRIAVPMDDARRRTDEADDARDDGTRVVSGLEAALSTLREQLEHERSRADQATAAAERSEVRLAVMAKLVRQALESALTAQEAANAKVEAALAAERAGKAKAASHAAALRQAEGTTSTLGGLVP